MPSGTPVGKVGFNSAENGRKIDKNGFVCARETRNGAVANNGQVAQTRKIPKSAKTNKRSPRRKKTKDANVLSKSAKGRYWTTPVASRIGLTRNNIKVLAVLSNYEMGAFKVPAFRQPENTEQGTNRGYLTVPNGSNAADEFAQIVDSMRYFGLDDAKMSDCVAAMHSDARQNMVWGSNYTKKGIFCVGKTMQDGPADHSIYCDPSYCLAYFTVYQVLKVLRHSRAGPKTGQVNLSFTTTEAMHALACESNERVKNAVVDEIVRKYDMIYALSPHDTGGRTDDSESQRANTLLNLHSSHLMNRGVISYPPHRLVCFLADKRQTDAVLCSHSLPRVLISRSDLARYNGDWDLVANRCYDGLRNRGRECPSVNTLVDGFVCKSYPGTNSSDTILRLLNEDGKWSLTDSTGDSFLSPDQAGVGDVQVEPYYSEFAAQEWRFYAQSSGSDIEVFYVVDQKTRGDKSVERRILSTEEMEAHPEHNHVLIAGKQLIAGVFNSFATTGCLGQYHSYAERGLVYRFDVFFLASNRTAYLNKMHVLPAADSYLTDLSLPLQADVFSNIAREMSLYITKHMKTGSSWPL